MNLEAEIFSLSESVQKAVLERFDHLSLRFLTQSQAPFKSYKVTPVKMAFQAVSEPMVFENNYRIYTHLYVQKFLMEGSLNFKSKDSGIFIDQNFKEEITIEVWFNPFEQKFEFELYNQEKWFLKEFNDKVREKWDRYDLIGFDNLNLKIDNKGLSSFFTDITRGQFRQNPDVDFFNDFNVFDDITRCTQDIRYMIGQLTLYRPYITNHLQEKDEWQGKTLFRYFPNFYDSRYFMTAELAIQLLYNYWDKIGDLLDCFFKVIPIGKDGKKRIYFGTVVGKVFKLWHHSDNCQWLNDFKKKEFNELLDKRNEIVHYKAISSKIAEGHLSNLHNEKEIQKLQAEKEALIDYFFMHNKLMLTGFEKALRLINEIPAATTTGANHQ